MCIVFCQCFLVCWCAMWKKISNVYNDLAERNAITVVLKECFILKDMSFLLVLSQEIKGAKLQQSTIGSISVGINKNANVDVCRFLSKGIFKEGQKRERREWQPHFSNHDQKNIKSTYTVQLHTIYQSPYWHLHVKLACCCYLTYSDTAKLYCMSAYKDNALVVHLQLNLHTLLWVLILFNGLWFQYFKNIYL